MSTNPPRLLAAMPAHPPRLPVLLFVFLAVHVRLPASRAIPPPPPSSYDDSICSKSFMCGGVNISYPFYLSDATREVADYGYYSCGYADLKISCQGEGPAGTPIISLGSYNYTVQDIVYDSHTIILADSDVFLGSGDCPAVRHEVIFNETWLHSTSSNDNLTFFFGCYPRGLAPPEFADIEKYKINCAGFESPPGGGPGYSFVLMSGELESYQEQDLTTNCSKVVTVPVRGDVLIAAITQSNFTSVGYGNVLKHGFELEWGRTTHTGDGCRLCEYSDGQCAYSQNREFMSCLCSGGKVGNPDCEHIVSPSTATTSRSGKSS